MSSPLFTQPLTYENDIYYNANIVNYPYTCRSDNVVSSHDQLHREKREKRSKERNSKEGYIKEGLEDNIIDHDCIEYYKSIINNIKNERLLYISKLEDCSISRSDYSKLRSELILRETEITELQKALSNAHLFLYDERQHIINLHSENDELKLQSIEDKKKMQHLLALTQPVTQEVTYLRDAKPHSVTRFPSNEAYNKVTTNNYVYKDTNISESTCNNTHGGVLGRDFLKENDGSISNRSHIKSAKKVESKSSLCKCNGTCKLCQTKNNNVIKTIYLPNDNADTLGLIIESLRSQLAEQISLFENQKKAFVEDRRIREEEIALHLTSNREKVANLEEMLKNSQNKTASTMRDYFELRHKYKIEEENWVLAKTKVNEIESTYAANLKTAIQINDQNHENARKESQAYIEQYRRQLCGSQESLQMVKEQFEAASRLYEAKINHLTEQNNKVSEKYRALETRYKLEVEGFESEITIIRKSVKNIGKHLNHARLTARYSADSEKLIEVPEFLALEERLVKISKMLNAWKNGEPVLKSVHM